MTITLVGGPFNDEMCEVADGTHVFVCYHKPISSMDEFRVAEPVEIRYRKVPGQDKYFIFEPYYKQPEL